jgi:pilus assembly protein TadC
MDADPEAFVMRSARIALMGGFGLAAIVFFFQGKTNPSIVPVLLAFVIGAYFMYQYLLVSPRLASSAIASDIDREVLFAGRFLLIKLNSGTPLVNALFEASRSEGVAKRYFSEIVRDIELGTPLEAAIERAMRASPSKHWRKILFQIHNALSLGIDVTNSLETVLEDIANDYLLQIQRYGKKLSTITLFYLLFAVVFPSLLMTIIVILLSFAGIPLTGGFFVAVIAVVAFIQVVFLQTFRSIRPKVAL